MGQKPLTKSTEFDGKKAFIVGGDHPHEGATATCLRAEHTHLGWGLVFRNENSQEEFFVFDPKNVQWK